MRQAFVAVLYALLGAVVAACSGPAQNQPQPAKPAPATQPATGAKGKNRPLPPLPGPPTTRPNLPPPPKPKPTLPTGSLSRVDIQQVIRRNQSQVRRCYERQLQKNPKLAGRLLVSIVVAVDGSVRDATIEHSTLNSPAVDSCVVAKVKSWVFPKPRGGIVVIKYPFVFRTSNP
jgi:TonB family protein